MIVSRDKAHTQRIEPAGEFLCAQVVKMSLESNGEFGELLPQGAKPAMADAEALALFEELADQVFDVFGLGGFGLVLDECADGIVEARAGGEFRDGFSVSGDDILRRFAGGGA